MSDAIRQKIKDLEEEYARTQKNKATEFHLGLVRARLSKLKKELIEGTTKSKGGGAVDRGFEVARVGDTRVGLIGFPSVGKSTLLTALTGTFSEAADYEFTTLVAIPGTLRYKGARIQILDLPGLIEGAAEGKGRGRQVISAARTCNMLLIILDATKPLTHKAILERELEGFGIRLNRARPPYEYIKIRVMERGGISITSLSPQSALTPQLIVAICREYRLHNLHVTLTQNASVQDFIDVVMCAGAGRRNAIVYLPAMYVLNKVDSLCMEELTIIDQFEHYLPLSARLGWNFDGLLEGIWKYCKMTRIYTKPKGQIPDFNEPIVLNELVVTVSSVCEKLHKGLLREFKYAWVWGRSVRHQPQKVGKDHVMEDEDVIQIVKKI